MIGKRMFPQLMIPSNLIDEVDTIFSMVFKVGDLRLLLDQLVKSYPKDTCDYNMEEANLKTTSPITLLYFNVLEHLKLIDAMYEKREIPPPNAPGSKIIQ
jgi:hypothetical protein